MNLLAKLLFCLFICTSKTCFCQEAGFYHIPNYKLNKYIILHNPSFQVSHVKAFRLIKTDKCTVKSSDTINTNNLKYEYIEIFNIKAPMSKFKKTLYDSFFQKNDTLLITMTVLPFKDGRITWRRILIDSVNRQDIHKLYNIAAEGITRIKKYRQTGSPADHKIIIRDNLIPIIFSNNEYYIPEPYILTEYFHIVNKKENNSITSDLATINIHSRIISKDSILKQIRINSNKPRLQLSYAITAGNTLQAYRNGCYEFWSNPATVVSEPDPLHYGSGDFIYKPGIGILSGKYIGYFSESSKIASDCFFKTTSITRHK